PAAGAPACRASSAPDRRRGPRKLSLVDRWRISFANRASGPRIPRAWTSVRWTASTRERTSPHFKRPRCFIFILTSASTAAPACPVEAIFALDETPQKWATYIRKNADYYGTH